MSAIAADAALPVAMATWICRLYAAGVAPDDPDVRLRCDAVAAAADRDAGNRAGEALVATMIGRLGGSEPADVLAAARALYGDRVRDDLGHGDRDERIGRIRKYQFGRQLPWLARIWERRGGVVAPTWLVIERVTDEVDAIDPNPWNDVDEARRIALGDFLVLWELDGCTSIAVR